MAGDGELPSWKLFLVAFAVLGVGNVAATLIVWRYSGGDRGWWPVHLCAFLTVSCVYALFFSRLHGTALARCRNAGLYTLVLAATLNAETFLYYSLPINWLDVNEGRVQLTFLQRIVRSAATPWATYGVFVVGAAMFAKRAE